MVPIKKLTFQMETCCRVFKRLTCLEPSHFVVVNAPGICNFSCFIIIIIISNNKTLYNILKYLCCYQIPATVQEPFYIAEVMDNDSVDEVLTVRWYIPSNVSKSRTQNFHQMNYEMELCPVGQSKGWQNGQVSIISYKVRSDYLHYQNITRRL
jgi:hypothetical protein